MKPEYFKKHEEEDRGRFDALDLANKAQEKDHEEFKKALSDIKDHMETSSAFMQNLSGVSDLVKGAGLMKKPMMLFVGLVIATVALMGGLKTIISWFVISK